MAREFLVSEYLDDDGTPWRLRVDGDYGLMADRGWVSGLTPGLPPLPREWLPRRVVGVDPTGRMIFARVATLSAPLWTGAATEFQFRASDGAFYVAKVIGRDSERRLL